MTDKQVFAIMCAVMTEPGQRISDDGVRTTVADAYKIWTFVDRHFEPWEFTRQRQKNDREMWEAAELERLQDLENAREQKQE